MPRFACLNALAVLHHITFQNRYKSIVYREDTYLKDLARYIHLNPVRAGTVSDIGELNRYPYSGHSGLMGRYKRHRQDVAYVLGHFGETVRSARHKAQQSSQCAGIDQILRSILTILSV